MHRRFPVITRRTAFAAPAVALLALAIGCGQGLNVRELPMTASPDTETLRLKSDLEQAEGESVNALAPTWFSRARDTYQEGERLRGRGAEVADVLEKISLARAQLEKAESVAAVTAQALPKAVKARREARAAGALDFGGEYSAAEQAFKDLARDVEDDDVSDAQEGEAKVERMFRDLELKAIQASALGDVRKIVLEAKDGGAAQYVPDTLAAVEKKIEKTEAFIADDRYNSKEIAARAQDALTDANRMLDLTKTAKSKAQMRPEELALERERIAKEQAELAKQKAAIEAEKARLQQERDALAGKTQELSAEVAAKGSEAARLKETAERLEAEKRFNERFVTVSGLFTREEAEVYRQGDSLVVRLKTMRFPVGKAIIGEENYALLAKVRKAIETFGAPSLTIEGHTDSTGSVASNELLSQKRAEAVKSYLVNNDVLSDQKIVAIGKGSMAPLASNTTAEG
ncbi:MAG: OmpA family protein, partial [Candidatus Methylomirabilis sp.]|nr:OmpA family protein [Deltaproteobacteria bacterium]